MGKVGYIPFLLTYDGQGRVHSLSVSLWWARSGTFPFRQLMMGKVGYTSFPSTYDGQGRVHSLSVKLWWARSGTLPFRQLMMGKVGYSPFLSAWAWTWLGTLHFYQLVTGTHITWHVPFLSACDGHTHYLVTDMVMVGHISVSLWQTWSWSGTFLSASDRHGHGRAHFCQLVTDMVMVMVGHISISFRYNYTDHLRCFSPDIVFFPQNCLLLEFCYLLG